MNPVVHFPTGTATGSPNRLSMLQPLMPKG